MVIADVICISRADVNRIICEYRDDAAETGSERDLERAYGANAVGALISKLPSVTPQEPRWIPCSERLPKDKETVLVTFKHHISGKTIGLGSVVVLRGKPHWHVREQNLGTYDVIAWMPLPKAYEPVESEKLGTLPKGHDCALWQPKVENHSIKMVTNAKEAENYPISEDKSKIIEAINKLLFGEDKE